MAGGGPLLISSLLSIALGVILLVTFPTTSLFVPGMFFGIDLLFLGGIDDWICVFAEKRRTHAQSGRRRTKGGLTVASGLGETWGVIDSEISGKEHAHRAGAHRKNSYPRAEEFDGQKRGCERGTGGARKNGNHPEPRKER